MKKTHLIFLGLFLPSLVYSQKVTPPLPQSMAALGDSSTAGMLSAHSRKGMWFPLNHIPVLIDSIELLFTFNKGAYEKRSFSWSTGSQIDSHYTKLKRLNPQIKAKNFALSSNKIKDVWEIQVPALLEWSRKSLRAETPDYITLLIGGNDFCAKDFSQTTNAAEYEKYLHLIVKTILSKNSQARVFILPIPRLDKLAETSAQAFVLASPKMSRCEDMWKMIPLCPTVTGATSSAKQKQIYDKIQSYNNATKNQTNKLRASYGDRVRVSWEEKNHLPHKDYLAVDCFHGNKAAQEDIARVSWKKTWWGAL